MYARALFQSRAKEKYIGKTLLTYAEIYEGIWYNYNKQTGATIHKISSKRGALAINWSKANYLELITPTMRNIALLLLCYATIPSTSFAQISLPKFSKEYGFTIL